MAHLERAHRESLGGDGEAPELGGTLRFMQLLWSVYHGLHTRSKLMEATLGVTGTQRLVVRLVGQFPGISAGTLALLLRVHKSTLTGVLSRLERRNLVARAAHPEDARRAVLELTEAGERIDRQRAGTVEAVLNRALHRVSERDAAAAERVLRIIAEELAENG